MRVSDKDIKKVRAARESAIKLFIKTGKQAYLHRADMYDKELQSLKRTRRLEQVA